MRVRALRPAPRRRSLRTAQKNRSFDAVGFSSAVLRVSSFSPRDPLRWACAGAPCSRSDSGRFFCTTLPRKRNLRAQVPFAMISVPGGTGDIRCAYGGTDIISHLRSKYIIRHQPYIISRHRYNIISRSEKRPPIEPSVFISPSPKPRRECRRRISCSLLQYPYGNAM